MDEIAHVVAVLGRGVVDPDAPVATADDLGLTRGDGCFDSVRVVTDASGAARAVDLGHHLDRLDRSAAALGLRPPTHDEWRGLVGQALEAWTTPGDAVLKLLLTRGREWRPGPPTAFVTVTGRPAAPASDDASEHRPARGIAAVTLSRGHPSDAFTDAPWLLGGVKTLSYVVNTAATREARRRGADDVVFTSTDGYALDGPTSGLLVVRDGVFLSTPTGGTGILESVTVAAVLDAARADGHEARYELVPVTDLRTAEGVWLVSSGRGPAPVTALDGERLRVDPGLVRLVAGYAGF